MNEGEIAPSHDQGVNEMTIDIATLATTLDTDPRTARKFMRSITPADLQPGKGSRWAIEKREVAGLRKKFAPTSPTAPPRTRGLTTPPDRGARDCPPERGG
jgi:hypothetical protein